MRPLPRVLSLAVVVLLAARAGAAEERWYTYSIGGTPVGHLSEVTREEEGAVRTDTVLFAKLNRLGKSFEMRFETVTREAPDGELRALSFESLLSQQATRFEVRVEGDRVHIAAGGQERAVERGPQPLLGPAAVARLTAQRLRAAGDAVEYAVFSPELQRVARVRRAVAAAGEPPCPAAAGGRALEETVEGLPVARRLWVDAAGATLADAIDGPFGAMTSCRATRDEAMAAAAGGTLPADLYERTVARSNLRLADAAAVDRLVLRVRPRDPAVPLPDLAAHNQRATPRDGGVLVEVRRPAAPAGAAPRERTAEEFLAPNALVESDDTAVVELAREIAGAEPDAYRAALALTEWTAEHMTMDAGIVMAPASELARDRRGTCMGYATLLAALARAAGIPSRIVMGYVYYGGIWGGHAWTEMWIAGGWLPFDAAVYAPGVASAARLAAGASSFQDGGGELIAAIGRLFARVEVDLLEVESGGRTLRVPEGRPAYTVAGSTYVNPGLGLRVDAEPYAVERADSTWPSTLVVAFRHGPTVIELHQRPLHPARDVAPRDGKAVFAEPEGATLWVWTAEGPDAAAALRRFLARVEKTPAS